MPVDDDRLKRSLFQTDWQPGLRLAVGHGHVGMTDSIATSTRIAEALLPER